MAEVERVLHRDVHKQFIKNHDKDKAEDFAYWMTEHLQVSGFYWGLGTMALFSSLDEMPKDEILGFVSDCFDKTSGLNELFFLFFFWNDDVILCFVSFGSGLFRLLEVLLRISPPFFLFFSPLLSPIPPSCF